MRRTGRILHAREARPCGKRLDAVHVPNGCARVSKACIIAAAGLRCDRTGKEDGIKINDLRQTCGAHGGDGVASTPGASRAH